MTTSQAENLFVVEIAFRTIKCESDYELYKVTTHNMLTYYSFNFNQKKEGRSLCVPAYVTVIPNRGSIIERTTSGQLVTRRIT